LYCSKDSQQNAVGKQVAHVHQQYEFVAAGQKVLAFNTSGQYLSFRLSPAKTLE